MCCIIAVILSFLLPAITIAWTFLAFPASWFGNIIRRLFNLATSIIRTLFWRTIDFITTIFPCLNLPIRAAISVATYFFEKIFELVVGIALRLLDWVVDITPFLRWTNVPQESDDGSTPAIDRRILEFRLPIRKKKEDKDE